MCAAAWESLSDMKSLQEVTIGPATRKSRSDKNHERLDTANTRGWVAVKEFERNFHMMGIELALFPYYSSFSLSSLTATL